MAVVGAAALLAPERGKAPEVGGEGATESLAVVNAGIKSVAKSRHVDMAEILAGDE